VAKQNVLAGYAAIRNALKWILTSKGASVLNGLQLTEVSPPISNG